MVVKKPFLITLKSSPCPVIQKHGGSQFSVRDTTFLQKSTLLGKTGQKFQGISVVWNIILQHYLGKTTKHFIENRQGQQRKNTCTKTAIIQEAGFNFNERTVFQRTMQEPDSNIIRVCV